jgi:hypothetical protein
LVSLGTAHRRLNAERDLMFRLSYYHPARVMRNGNGMDAKTKRRIISEMLAKRGCWV